MPEIEFNADDRDKVAAFIEHVYHWSFERPPQTAKIPEITKEYKDIRPILSKYTLDIGDILYSADEEAKFSDFYFRARDKLLDKEKSTFENSSFVNVKKGDFQFKPEAFRKVLGLYANSLVSLIQPEPEERLDIRMAIRKEVENAMRTDIKLEKRFSAENNDSLIKEYKDLSLRLTFEIVAALLKHPKRDEIIKDPEIKSAIRMLAAVAAWQNNGADEGAKSFYKAYLESEKEFPGDHLFTMSVDDAINRIDELLIAKGIGDALKTQIVRKFTEVTKSKEPSK